MDTETNIRLELTTREKELLTEDVTMVVVPSGMGPIAILPGHAPIIGTVETGIVRARSCSGNEFTVFVDKGFFMVSSKTISIVSRVAEFKDQIDVDRAKEAAGRAQSLIESRDKNIDAERAKEAQLRAQIRLKISEISPNCF